MGVLRQRQDLHRKQATEARRRPAEARTTERLLSLSAASIQADYEDAIRARWQGGPTVLAFLFAHPDSDAIRMLDVRGDYFDQRTGDTWDLFFPGYYKSTQAARFEDETGARAVDVGYTDGWYFNARDFNMLREHVERASQGRWAFSGGTDLVLINGWMPDSGEPEIDWASTLSGQITDHSAGTKTLTLAGVIERITRDLETAAEDAAYGVGEVVEGPQPVRDPLIRDLFVNALGGIAAALGAHGLGA